MAIDDAAVKDVGLQASVLVLVFGYADGEAAIREAIGHALAAGPWSGLPAGAIAPDEDGRPALADPALGDAVVARVQAFLGSPAGVADVEAYVAANFRDLGPVGVGLEGVGARLRERFAT